MPPSIIIPSPCFYFCPELSLRSRPAYFPVLERSDAGCAAASVSEHASRREPLTENSAAARFPIRLRDLLYKFGGLFTIGVTRYVGLGNHPTTLACIVCNDGPPDLPFFHLVAA